MTEQWIVMIIFSVVVLLSAILLNVIQNSKDPEAEEQIAELQKCKDEYQKSKDEFMNNVSLYSEYVNRYRKICEDQEAQIKVLKKELIQANDLLIKYQTDILKKEKEKNEDHQTEL